MIRLDLGNIVTGVVAFLLLLTLLYAAGLAAQRDEAQADVARMKAEVAAIDADARRRALETELRHAADMQALAETLEKEQADAEKKHAGVVAGLERGALRLRQQWQGCQARLDGMPAAAETTAIPDAAAQLRATGVADLLRVGAECDARLRAWQSYARSVTGER